MGSQELRFKRVYTQMKTSLRRLGYGVSASQTIISLPPISARKHLSFEKENLSERRHKNPDRDFDENDFVHQLYQAQSKTEKLGQQYNTFKNMLVSGISKQKDGSENAV